MTKHILFSLAALAALPLSARERTDAELRAEAEAALHRFAVAEHRAPAAWDMAGKEVILQRQAHLSVVGYTSGGYAFVSHDDRIPAVLGYSDEIYNPLCVNPILTSYLDDLNGYIDYCLSTGREFRVIRKAGGVNGSVGPLLTTLWDQGYPYFLDCPKWQLINCVTGCVATAAAMILNYHQLPKTMHGRKIYTYTNQGKGRTRIVYNYSEHEFDWDNMRDTYTGNGITREERLAVAALMYACGVNASMNYTTTESGAFPYTEADGINWFMDGVRADYYALSGKEQLVYDELDASRPLLYGGNKEGAGHAFVIDGYDENGLLHCNLGWSGSGNNYFLMTDMAGYSSGQGIVTIYPSEEPVYVGVPGADMPIGRVTVSTTPAEEIIPDTQWYLLYNVGRQCHPFTQGKGKTIMNTCYLPIDDDPEMAAPHIVRFVTSTNESKPGYFIQCGEGWYFGSLKQGGNKGTTSTKTCNYNYGLVRKDTPGYFWIRDEKDNLIMDSNGAGADMVGYGDTRPTDTLSNASWQLFPVSFAVPDAVKRIEADEVHTASSAAKVYDLNGRAATKPRDSYNIIIKDGRKVIR